MNLINKKMAVFEVLRHKGGELSLQEVLNILGPDYSERTVRRWLADMVSTGLSVNLSPTIQNG